MHHTSIGTLPQQINKFAVEYSLWIKHCQRHNGPEGWVHIPTYCTNVDQTISEFWLSINFQYSAKPSLRILTKVQLRNLNQTSASKYWPNFSFKISPELQLQTPDQTLCWKSEQNFSFMTKPQLPDLQQTKLPTRFSSSLLATVATSTSFE